MSVCKHIYGISNKLEICTVALEYLATDCVLQYGAHYISILKHMLHKDTYYTINVTEIR